MLIAIVLGTAACASSHRGKSGAPMPGTVPSTSGDIAIARVQASSVGQGFRFFPNGQTSVGCLIPGPGAKRIKGTCQTRAVHSGASVIRVTFTEFWPARKFRTSSGPPVGTLHHSWDFEIRANGRVVLVGDHGDVSPQSAD
jgi:hypothetical protein